MMKVKILLMTMFCLISAFLCFSEQQIFAQKKGRSKMIVLPTPTPKPVPKEMFFEIKITGGGGYECRPGSTCTWSVDRKYSGTVVFNEFMKVPAMPFDVTKLEPGSASAITAKKQPRTAPPAFYFRWLTIPTTPQSVFYDVTVSINDEVKVSWQETESKDNVKMQKTKTITQSWIGSKTGKGVRGGEVTLDTQTRKIKFVIVPDSDAEVTYKVEKNWEEMNDLPKQESVPVPRIEGYLNSEVTLPMFGDISNLKSVGFEKTFSGLKSEQPLLVGIEESKEASITVTYKFK
jgi:hypothetical protein